MTDICELCLREGVETTVHHLTPREEGGLRMPTAELCIPCHKQVHALYTNKELAVHLNTISLLHQDERIQSYLKWIRKQPAETVFKTKSSNAKKRR